MDVRYDLHESSAFINYVHGSAFDDNLRISFDPPPPAVPDRIDILEKISAGKKIVHLGFCDHLPIVETKIAQNRWLHARLKAVAIRCAGVDIDAVAVEVIRSRYGVDDVASGDMTSHDILPIISSDHWDLLVVGEVLEHIDNPVQFLAQIRELYRVHIDRIVITVPNAFRAGNFLGALKGIETINSDHRFFFTPYTLTKVAHQAGLQSESLTFAQFSEVSGIKRLLKKFILGKAPLLSENLILVARM